MPVLTVEDIHFAYDGTTILRGIGLKALDGELVGLVGPNGSGKTTLLRLISGVLKPDIGRICVDGQDLARVKAGERARLVSVVPQTPMLPLSFRVLDLVLMGRTPHLKLLQWEGVQDLDIARQAMQMTDTWHLADRPIGNLSGGERQRALVAMALSQDAPVMLLDEPTSSLDLAHQTGVMDLVKSVQEKRGGVVVVAMHDLTLAAQYCDRVVIVSEGRCFAQGEPTAVFTKENISRVYGAEVIVLPHPQGATPVVLPVSSGRPREKGPAECP